MKQIFSVWIKSDSRQVLEILRGICNWITDQLETKDEDYSREITSLMSSCREICQEENCESLCPCQMKQSPLPDIWGNIITS